MVLMSLVSTATMMKGLSIDSAPSRSQFLSQKLSRTGLVSITSPGPLGQSRLSMCQVSSHRHLTEILRAHSPLPLILLYFSCMYAKSLDLAILLPLWGSPLPFGLVGFWIPWSNSKAFGSGSHIISVIWRNLKENSASVKKQSKILFQLLKSDKPNLVTELQQLTDLHFYKLYQFTVQRNRQELKAFLLIASPYPGTVHFSWSISFMG